MFEGTNGTLAGLKSVATTDCAFDQSWPVGFDSYTCAQVAATATKKYDIQIAGFDATGSYRNVLVLLSSAGGYPVAAWGERTPCAVPVVRVRHGQKNTHCRDCRVRVVASAGAASVHITVIPACMRVWSSSIFGFASLPCVSASPWLPAPPANDAFAKRTTLSGASGYVNASNAFATLEAGEPNHAWTLFDPIEESTTLWQQTAVSGTVWFKWTPPATASVATIRAQPARAFAATFVDYQVPNPVLSVYEDTGSLSTLKLVVYDRYCDVYSASGSDAGSLGQACVSIVPAGRTFAIQVAYDAPLWGPIDVVFTSSAAPAISNDHFAGRSSVSALTPSSAGSRQGACLEVWVLSFEHLSSVCGDELTGSVPHTARELCTL